MIGVVHGQALVQWDNFNYFPSNQIALAPSVAVTNIIRHEMVPLL